MNDAVNHPAHYTSDPSGVECITITRHRNFNIGNAIKYLWRCGLKEAPGAEVNPTTQDMNKAIWYIADEIKRLGGAVTVKIGGMQLTEEEVRELWDRLRQPLENRA